MLAILTTRRTTDRFRDHRGEVKLRFLLTGLLAIHLFVLDPSLASEDRADAEAAQVFGAFEFYCLELVRNQKQIPRLLEGSGAMELPGDQSAAFLAPHGGRAWMMRGIEASGDPFVIGLTDTNACTVFSSRVNTGDFLKLFRSHTRNSKLNEEKIGSQILYLFAVSHNDQFHDGDAHAVVLITVSQISEGKGVIANAIPEAALSRNGINLPPWPR